MLYVNFSVKCLNFATKWSLSYFQPILAAIFVYIATVSQINTRLLHLGYFSNKLIRRNWWKTFLFLASQGGGGGGEGAK